MKIGMSIANSCLLTFGLAALTSVATAASVTDRDPSGETADYVLDHSSSRTSNMVQDGSLHASVGSYDPSGQSGPTYDVSIDYSLKVLFLGWQRGTETMAIDAAYFTPDFMAQLREDGTYTGAKFKMRWLSFQDVSTLDGNAYQHCDRIYIYDIDAGFNAPIARLARALLRPAGAPLDAAIDDLEIYADIVDGVPVLGAVKLDVTGRYRGVNIKAGADYQAP